MRADFLMQGIRSMVRRRRKLYPTLLSISIGMMLVVIVSTVGEIGTGLVEEEIQSLGVGSITITANKTVADVPLTTEKLETLRGQPEVESASPIVMAYTQIELKGRVEQCAVWGIDSGSSQIVELDRLHGRLLEPADLNEQRRVCVIDQSLAEKIYQRSNIVGKKLQILLNNTNQEFEIVGVAESGGSLVQSVLNSYAPGFVYIPYNVLQKESGKTGYDRIAVTLSEPEAAEQKGKSLADSLIRKFGEQENSYTIENMFAQKQKMERIGGIVKLSLVAISTVSLVVSGLGVMTVMSASVTERIREIGIKKAIGAKNHAILGEFVLEGFLLSISGTILGLVTGQGIGWSVCRILGVDYQSDPGLLAIGAGITILLGTIFSAKPAIQAAQLDPVKALASE